MNLLSHFRGLWECSSSDFRIHLDLGLSGGKMYGVLIIVGRTRARWICEIRSILEHILCIILLDSVPAQQVHFSLENSLYDVVFGFLNLFRVGLKNKKLTLPSEVACRNGQNRKPRYDCYIGACFRIQFELARYNIYTGGVRIRSAIDIYIVQAPRHAHLGRRLGHLTRLLKSYTLIVKIAPESRNFNFYLKNTVWFFEYQQFLTENRIDILDDFWPILKYWK